MQQNLVGRGREEEEEEEEEEENDHQVRHSAYFTPNQRNIQESHQDERTNLLGGRGGGGGEREVSKRKSLKDTQEEKDRNREEKKRRKREEEEQLLNDESPETPSSSHPTFPSKPSQEHQHESTVTLLEAGLGVVYGRRWLMLFLFSLAAFINNLSWLSYASVDVTAAIYYDKSAFLIDLQSIVYMVTAASLMFVGSWVIDRYSLRHGVLIASLLNLLGCWIRAIGGVLDPVTSGYWVLLVGAIVVSLAQTIFLVGPPKLASIWFGVAERTIATSIGALSPLVGMAVAYALGPNVVKTGEDFSTLYSIHASIATFSTLLIFILFEVAPLTPPSITADTSDATMYNTGEDESKEREGGGRGSLGGRGKKTRISLAPSSSGVSIEELTEKRTFKEVLLLFELFLTSFLPLDKFLAEFKAMLKNRQFLILQGSFGIGYGIFVALLSDLDQILATYHYTELQAGNLGIILICSGIAGAFTMGVVIDKFGRQYRRVLMFGFCGAGLGLIGIFFALQPNRFGVLCFTLGITGFFSISMLPVALETAVEITYPQPESTSAAIMIFTGNVFAVIYSFSVTAVQNANGNPAYLFFTSFVSLMGMLFFNPTYKRLAFEKTVSSSTSSSNN